MRRLTSGWAVTQSSFRFVGAPSSRAGSRSSCASHRQMIAAGSVFRAPAVSVDRFKELYDLQERSINEYPTAGHNQQNRSEQYCSHVFLLPAVQSSRHKRAYTWVEGSVRDVDYRGVLTVRLRSGRLPVAKGGRRVGARRETRVIWARARPRLPFIVRRPVLPYGQSRMFNVCDGCDSHLTFARV